MPTPPFALVQTQVNGGGAFTGTGTAPSAAVIQWSGTNTTGWKQALWEVFDFPAGTATVQTGWTYDATRQIFSSTAFTPPTFQLPVTTTTNWGKTRPRLTVNGGLTSGAADPTLVDTSAGLKQLSPKGQEGLSFLEGFEFSSSRAWVAGLMASLRAVEVALAGGGGGSVPTGTGFAHITSGAQDAAAALVDPTNTAHVVAPQMPTDLQCKIMYLPRGLVKDSATALRFQEWHAETKLALGSAEYLLNQATAANQPLDNLAISSSTAANPSVITTAQAHNLVTGDVVVIDGHAVNTAANGIWSITVLSATTFSIPVLGNGVGTASGYVTLLLNGMEVLSPSTAGASPTYLGVTTIPAWQLFVNGYTASAGRSDFAAWGVFRAHSVTGVNALALTYLNEQPIDIINGNLGVALRNSTGTYFLDVYAYDGAVKTCSAQISLDTWYVWQVRKSGGSIYLKVGTLAETGATAVGALNYTGAGFTVGKSGSGATNMNGAIASALTLNTSQVVAADTAATGALARMRRFLGGLFSVAVN